MVVPHLPPPDQEGVPRKDDAPFPLPPAGELPVGDRRIERDVAPEDPKPFGELPEHGVGEKPPLRFHRFTVHRPQRRRRRGRSGPFPAALPPPPCPPVSPVPRGWQSRRRSAPSRGGGTGTSPVPASARRGPRSRWGTSRFPFGTQAPSGPRPAGAGRSTAAGSPRQKIPSPQGLSLSPLGEEAGLLSRDESPPGSFPLLWGRTRTTRWPRAPRTRPFAASGKARKPRSGRMGKTARASPPGPWPCSPP